MAQQKTANIVILGGDGVGPEVAAEAVKILKIVSDKRSATRNIQFNFEEELIGLASMDKTGKHYYESRFMMDVSGIDFFFFCFTRRAFD
jgi:isocitrate/isopropylmalate dehydrogenase